MNDLEANRDTWPDVYVTVETKELEDLRTRLQTAEQTIRYCNDLLAPVIGDLAAPLEQLCRSAARSIQESDQQLGQVREEVRRLLAFVEKASRLDTSQTCSLGNEDVVLGAMEILSATPSDGCGKGRVEKGNCRCLACGHIHFWNERIIGPFGGHTYCPKVQCIHAQYEQLTEAAFSIGKEGGE